MQSLSADFNRSALVIIDVQPGFAQKAPGCSGNDATEEITAKIAALMPVAREQGVPIYIIGMRQDCFTSNNAGAFYGLDIKDGDRLVFKTGNSAMRSSDLHRILSEDGIENLMICGFNYNYCVFSTAMDARTAGYNVTLLTDLAGAGDDTEDDRSNTTPHMKSRGIRLAPSRKVFAHAP